MKRLYFCRHGESELNTQGIFAGQIDTPLTVKGREQAALAGSGAAELNLDLIVSSPLVRALETAQIIAEKIGYSLDQIVTNKLLMERSYGSFAGQPFSAVPDPQLYPDIETDAELTVRAQAALDFLYNLTADTILIVGHGDYAKMLRGLIDHQTNSEELPNAQITQLI